MKFRNSALLCALFLLLGASLAFAAPADLAAAADSGSAASLSAGPAMSELASTAACEADASPFMTSVFTSKTRAGLDESTCGSCSQNPCKGAPAWSVCGISGGQLKYCQDYLGSTCAADGGALCRCSNAPLP